MERKSFRVMEEESGRNECLKQKCRHWASGDLVVVTSGEVGESWVGCPGEDQV